MGKLDDLEKELYSKESEEDVARRMRSRITFLGTLRKLPTSWWGREKQQDRSEVRVVSVERRALKYFFAGLAIFLIVGVSAFIFFYLGTRGQEVEVTIHGRDRLESGEVVTIPILLRNVSNTVLRDPEAIIILPSGTVLVENGIERPAPPRITESISDLAPGDEAVIEISTRMFGHEGEEKELEVRFLYRPENLEARFATKEFRVFTISRVPLALFWKTPETFSHGQEVNIEVRYTSTARVSFENLAVRIEHPPGFIFKSANPEPTVGETIWEVGRLEPGEEGMITLQGSIMGEEGEIKAFRGSLGVFNSLTKEWRSYSDSGHTVKIAVAPLSVQGFLNGRREYTVIPGEDTQFAIRYQNNTSSILRNITVRAFLEGDILLFNTLSIGDGGVFDSLSKSLVWGPGNTPELREVGPGAGGIFEFSMRTREQPIVRGPLDRNLTITFRTTIEPNQVPEELIGTDLVSGDELAFRVATKVLFSGGSVYYDSPISNTGSIPPKVGKETTYTIVWEIRNFTNDLNNVEVKTFLPPNVKWQNVVSPDTQAIQYNAVSNEVRWNIGTLPAGVGVLSPARLGAFQVSIIPAESDVGIAVRLTGQSTMRGVDAFTGQEITRTLETFTTELSRDRQADFGDGNVIR